MVIRAVEGLSGRRRLQRIYDELYEEQATPINLWEKTLNKLDIAIDYDEEQLGKVPKSGPVIFVANHPFGIVDGAILCHLVSRVRPDYFLLVNEVVSHEPLIGKHFLPVDFRTTREALMTNLATKKETTERLNRGEVLAIFPSGGVSTAKRVWGEVEEFPWRRFIGARIHATQCTVVPIYFHGRNSRLFQLVSKVSMNLRLGLLLFETVNKKGKKFRVEIGNPIPYETMRHYRNRQDLIDYLQAHTLALGWKE